MTAFLQQSDFEKIFKDHLKIETYSKSIDSLLSPRLLNKTDYSPYYQRNYVWDDKKASYFIESILLGTEIPPLIFFNNNTNIEVIDGRQRFETILRFKENKFSLNKNGLTVLPQLVKNTYDDLAKKDKDIIESFLDAKIRIIEFALVNEPPLDKLLEDRVKKEIFSRYNTGITPLKRSEIDNAIYDDDEISVKFKKLLRSDDKIREIIYKTFFASRKSWEDNLPLDQVMQFVRKTVVLSKMPIKYYAQGKERTNTLTKLYEQFSDTCEDADQVIEDFIKKVSAIYGVKNKAREEGLQTNRLMYECLLWALFVCDSEEINFAWDYENNLFEFVEYAAKNIEEFSEQDHHYQKAVMQRYLTTAAFFEKKFKKNLNIYLDGSPERQNYLRELRETTDTNVKLGELESLRLNKPEPARNSIEDIRRVMQRRRFLVRPSYQRKEVINLPKASSIIESILLGITLPAIFIYKRNDGINEVVDGQQRILTILGYIGSEYIDENEDSVFSKNHKFPLRKLRILDELKGLKFHELTDEQQDKILDFQLYVVEIEQSQNPEFDPIDLFIRLNDKPYPIRENSFEMWNSWADYDVIEKIRDLRVRYHDWFYVRQIKSDKDRDRMLNEELLTALAFLTFYVGKNDSRKLFDVYQKTDRINARIGNKAYISQLLQEVAEKEDVKKEFFTSIKDTENFIKKLKIVLLDQDKTQDELNEYLKSELDTILKGRKGSKHFRRTMQDFYLLWELLESINYSMVKHHRIAMKEDIKNIFEYVKNIPESEYEDNKGFVKYKKILEDFKNKYRKDERKIKLTELEKINLIKEQNNRSGISGSPVFLGDDVEVDHTIPLAIGGKDDLENLQITHKDENRSKGAKLE